MMRKRVSYVSSAVALVLVLLLLFVMKFQDGRRSSRPSTENETEVEAVVEDEVETEVEAFLIEELSDELFESMQGKSFREPSPVGREDLRHLSVLYVDFNGETGRGDIVCNRAIAEDLLEIFTGLYEASYPIESIRLIDDFDGDDDASMKADNTSCFNVRPVSGDRSRFSDHAYGLAIDINPLYNPYVRTREGHTVVKPEGSEVYADRSRDFPHKIDREDLCYKLFREHGFTWGGGWASMKDFQHFTRKK